MPAPRSTGERSLNEQIGALVDERLLALLHRAFPAVPVQPGIPMDAVMFDAGKQALLRTLREYHEMATRPET